MSIKLIICDLDGVLVNARELHYDALNNALQSIDPKYVIHRPEHLSTYDGLPTTKKLKMLTTNKGLPVSMYDEVWKRKQQETIKIIDTTYTHDERMIDLLKKLTLDGYRICVASNSIRETVKMMLLRKGFTQYIEFFYSNQDVRHPKPATEMYLRCMIKAGVSPKETLIIEDSHIGRKGAFLSGAVVCGVEDAKDTTYDKIKRSIIVNDYKGEPTPKWQGGELNILVPMAGAGARFEQAGYTFPKPLIDVNGKPMIQITIDNLNIDANFIFIVQAEHYKQYNLRYLLNLIAPNCKIVQIDHVTDGAACTTLLAKEYINNDAPLLISNSDQYFEWNSNEFMYAMIADDIDGGILTFKATHPKWSFAKLNDEGYVCEVAEKKPISNIATAGVYYWKRGSDYVKYAEQMINKDIRTNNEFYVCPVYNEAIEDGQKVKVFNIEKMWGLGTPEDLDTFLKHHE